MYRQQKVLDERNYDPQFKPVKGIYEDRLRQFLDKGGPYSHQNLPKFYDYERIGLGSENVKVQWWQVGFEEGTSPVSPDKRPSWKSIIEQDKKGELEFRDSYIGQPFGPSWTTTWFKIKLKLPSEWIGKKVIFDWDCSNEGVVIDPETLIPATAFSGNERTEYQLPKNESGEYFFYIESGNNGMFGCGAGSTINPPEMNRYFTLIKADIVLPDWEARALRIDFWMLGDAARELPDDSWQKHKARQVGNMVMDLFDPEDRNSVVKCRELLHKEFMDDFADSHKVYQHGSDVMTSVYGIGNCHIDTAWLWPFAETRRKIVRSWSSQCTLIDEFPEYQFVASQAQQFKWLLEDHPEFFKNVLVPKVQSGQFIPIGGSWVENDTNMPSGESLARQFFFGQRFFIKHLGTKTQVFWLPDTFGYSSQVPQICRLSGIDKFLTQKLSWNNINSFPHSTFNWAGIDGSQLVTHMPPGNTYTADSHFGDVLRSSRQNKTTEFYSAGLMLYGKGDGGGGPTREMLEKMRRIRSISNRNGNVIPKLDVGKSVEDFYEDVLKKTDNGVNLPTWNGELYFEFHRGTYTSQARTKKDMRFSEIKIHDLEWIATKTSILCSDYKYPINEINELWEDILLCQFHDVLPGSCIEMVYKYEAIPKLEDVIETCDKLIEKALDHLKKYSGKSLVNVTTIPWSEVSEEKLADAQTKKFFASVKDKGEFIVLANGKWTLTIDKKRGIITSLIDSINEIEYLDTKNGRNKFGANQFVIFDDKPLSWQAWDTELYSVNQFTYLEEAEEVKISSDSGHECTVDSIFKISENCKVKTSVTLRSTDEEHADESIISIKTNVDNWESENKFLKVEFPVNVRNEYASYETQFGITKRPTHYNTSWDVAKFEVCNHKFADYSEFTKGVSILNDCKYGFSVHGNLMRLSLLRSPKAPDAHADMGSHEINYAIYPHKGSLGAATVKAAIDFNYKHKYPVPKDIVPKLRDILTITGEPNVILSNLKRGEDDEELNSDYSFKPSKGKSVVARVYESLGGESRATLKTSLPLRDVYLIDNLELETYKDVKFHKLDDGNYEIPISLKPFEIASFKLVF
ncbi:Alpha-mannosidase [Nakaseomyces bracarensis]|uniref:alpha-mannosidase n=1 Tax=Nakaseomyces bracarensis TaxID=273131 RepID=A0ABR4NZQ3_9SACH